MNIEETVELLQTTVRVLVVDDVELWQTFVHMHLDKEPNLHVIGVAADGLEAVRKAEEQLPDLILLGVSLPKLNGLEAARQIREVAPKSRILFLIVDSDPDFVLGAFRLGVFCYVCNS